MLVKFNILLTLFLMSICALSSSCNRDDEPKSSKPTMAITSMYGGWDGREKYYFLKDVTYDSQCRPTSWTSVYTPYTAQYSDSTVIVREGKPEYGKGTIFLVSDGLVKRSISNTTSTREEWQYSYNNSNQLISEIKSDTPPDYNYYYHWINGNIARVDSYRYFEYYDEPNVLGTYQSYCFSLSFFQPGRDTCSLPLVNAGLFGAIPKNMLKAIYSNWKKEYEFYYFDYNEYGYPCTMVMVDCSDYETQTYEFTWVKL